MQPSLVIVDICGTLFSSNTTFDFLDYYIQKKSYRLFRKFSRRFIWKAFNKCCMAIFGKDVTRIIAVKYLKGHSRVVLEKAVDDFYTNRLKPLEHSEVTNLVKHLKQEGNTIMLVSATLEFIAARIAKELNIGTYYATGLMYDNERCLGTIDRDLLGGKLDYLHSIGIIPPFAVTITDDLSDMPLLSASDLGVVVSKERLIPVWKRRLSNHPNYQVIHV